MKNNKHFIDYVEFEKSYCHALEPNLKRVWVLAKDESVSLDYLKRTVFNIVKDAKVTDKKLEFLANVDAMDNKEEIGMYLYNAVKKAKETVVDKERAYLGKKKYNLKYGGR